MNRRDGKTTDRLPLSVRLEVDLHRRLQEAAAERDVSATLLISRALEDYLDRLVPVDEITKTRDE